MPWLQLHIPSTAREAEAISQALDDAGAASVTFQDRADEPILEPALGETPLWQQTRVTGLFPADCDTRTIVDRLGRELDKPLTGHHWELLEDKDWEREWMQHYQPIDCGSGLWICPSWLPPPEPEATNVLLDPGLAFGTGTHPTTLLCLQWLALQNVKDKTVVDYGCGSGILGIAALLRGAKHVIAVDIDPQALLATRENAKRNGIPAHQIDTALPGKHPPPADLVFANILAGPLVELAPTLAALIAPGGKLCLSGILASQAAPVSAAYADGVEFEPPRTKAEWVQLAGSRRP